MKRRSSAALVGSKQLCPAREGRPGREPLVGKAHRPWDPEGGRLEPAVPIKQGHSNGPLRPTLTVQPALVSPLVPPCTLLSKQTRLSGSALLANTPDLATTPRINKHSHTARLHTHSLTRTPGAP